MENKRFDDYPKVDCNECAKYWDSSCDGVKCNVNSDKSSTGSTRLCNSFLPVRKVVIPAQIKALEERCDSLRKSLFFTEFMLWTHLIFHALGLV